MPQRTAALPDSMRTNRKAARTAAFFFNPLLIPSR
jgi:hypothetical protein